MARRFEYAGSIFRANKTTDGRRNAARNWLSDAISWALENGEDVAPALDLMGALEGLEFGHVDPMLRLPEGQSAGGKEGPPAEIEYWAFAIAAVDRLIETGKKAEVAIVWVADDLGLGAGSLKSKRKHVHVERAKPKDKRMRYFKLIDCYETERARMAHLSEGLVCFELARRGELLGIESSLTPVP